MAHFTPVGQSNAYHGGSPRHPRENPRNKHWRPFMTNASRSRSALSQVRHSGAPHMSARRVCPGNPSKIRGTAYPANMSEITGSIWSSTHRKPHPSPAVWALLIVQQQRQVQECRPSSPHVSITTSGPAQPRTACLSSNTSHPAPYSDHLPAYHTDRCRVQCQALTPSPGRTGAVELM